MTSGSTDGRARFTDRVVIVTAGGGAIGGASAEAFGAEGARVAVFDVDQAAAQRTVDAIVAGGGTAAVHLVDLLDQAAVEQAVGDVVKQWGRVDVLLNNAGRGSTSGIEMSEEQWDREITFNLKPMFLASRAVWDQMVSQGGGVILNSASIASYWAMPSLLAYSTAKAGVIMFTKCLALDGGKHGIRVNCVSLGHLRTPVWDTWIDSMEDPEAALAAVTATVPLGYLARLKPAASAYVYLASDDAAWVNGTNFVVDGGTTVGEHA